MSDDTRKALREVWLCLHAAATERYEHDGRAKSYQERFHAGKVTLAIKRTW